MTLKELVQLLNNAQNLTTKDAANQILKTFASITTVLQRQNNDQIDIKKQQILKLLKLVDLDIIDICNNLQKQIDGFVNDCNQKSLEIYNNGVLCDKPDYLFEKNLQYFRNIPEDIKQTFLEKIKTKIDCRFPAMEIRPNNAYVTDTLVACDPLYLVDTNASMFGKVQSAWNKIYQQRVRYYTINEQNSKILNNLPDNQFGLIVSVDFFDHRHLELVQLYLAEFYTKLRPGGTAFFTFNDCDYPEGIETFNNMYYCYTPGHTIIEYCDSIGYIVKERHRFNGASSYLEVQKPGKITTIRAGQTLGKIIEI